MATLESLTSAVDQVIAHFNARKMDLPDGFFDRKAQFVLNGAPFETLLGRSEADPLILMLTRGAAGFRFTAKAVQHALPDASIDRGEIIHDGDPFRVKCQLWLSGTLRGTGEAIDTLVMVVLHLTPTGLVDVAGATVDEAALDKIRQARLRP